jgi:thymidylate synthase (FAD)
MGKFVQPEVYLVGATALIPEGLAEYLRASGNGTFVEHIKRAKETGLSDGEILCSFYAKLCYASLSEGKNANVSRTREIADNIKACFDAGHGSVFEHAQLNFVARNVSRVFTHELVRHRVGTAFSQTSGRYVRLDSIDFVYDPMLEPVADLVREHLSRTEELVYTMECELGLREPDPEGDQLKWKPSLRLPMDLRKKFTSAIRRVAPNGQANEIGFSVNLRSLRHCIMMRTGRQAEREMRCVFAEVYRLVRDRWPGIFCGAQEATVDSLLEVTGMRMQPYS